MNKRELQVIIGQTTSDIQKAIENAANYSVTQNAQTPQTTDTKSKQHGKRN